MAVLFISDLHLDAARPEAIDRFERFMAGDARRAETVYVLGDLFEAWIGDDDDSPGLRPVVAALGELTRSGVPCYFMHGNRDFLVGERFADETGCRLLGDYETIAVHGERVLLTHGDLLCTDDTRYMTLRAELRSPAWQREFLAKPLDDRRRIARDLRELSQAEMAAKTEAIMDVNDHTVRETMRRFGVRTLLHGHTHRPSVHRFELDGAPAVRIVLGDWYEAGSVVRWTEDGFELLGLGA